MGLTLLLAACSDAPANGATVVTGADAGVDAVSSDDAGSDGVGTADVVLEDDVVAVADVASTPDVGESPALCGVDRTEAAVAALRRLALDTAAAVISGSVGTPFERSSGEWYVPFVPETVHYGWTFTVAMTVNVPIPRGQTVEPGTRVVVGLSQNHPARWDSGSESYWSNVTAMVPLADVPADVLDWTRHRAPLVGIVKLTALDEQRATFELVEALTGDFPTSTFQDNWYADWGISYPKPSDDVLYLASIEGIGEYPAAGGGTTHLASIVDFRPVLDSLVASVEAPDVGSLSALRAERDRLRLAWTLHRAETVVTGRVTGLASECCTGAGGTYVRYDRTGVLAGEAPASFTLGGHGYYGPEACSDEYLLAPRAFSDGPQMAEPFSCETFDGPGSMTAIGTRLIATPETIAEAKAWIAGAPPVLQLHSEGQGVPGAPPDATLPWSAVMDAADAFSMATHIALMTVVDVEVLDGGHRVTLETTWSTYEYEHLKRHRVSVAFTCGDDRLLVLGSRWLAPVVMLGAAFDDASNPEDAFLLPGVLAPEWAIPDQLRNTLELRLNP